MQYENGGLVFDYDVKDGELHVAVGDQPIDPDAFMVRIVEAGMYRPLRDVLESLMDPASLRPNGVVPSVLTGTDAAAYLGVHANTLIRWRQENKGPAFSRYGTRVVYRKEDLDGWLQQQLIPAGGGRKSVG